MRSAEWIPRIGCRGIAFVAIATLGLLLVASAPPALAQCSAGPRVFASIGGGMNPPLPKVRVNPLTAWNQGDEIGRFWQSDNSNLGNNWSLRLFTPDEQIDPNRLPLENGCPSQDGWWRVSQTTLRGLEGVIGVTSCEAGSCPGGDVTFVVEDYAEGGPPGINAAAHFIAFRVDQTPGGIRYWDLAKVGSDGQQLLFLQFPFPTIKTSAAIGTDRLVTMDYANVAFHSHVGHDVSNPVGIDDLDVIASYDLMLHTGTSDPGRDRYLTGCEPPNPGGNCWTLIDQQPFTGLGPEGVVVTVPCNSTQKDSYIALGMSFKGGSGGNVESALVGRALQVECDPNLADPNPIFRPGARGSQRLRTKGPLDSSRSR